MPVRAFCERWSPPPTPREVPQSSAQSTGRVSSRTQFRAFCGNGGEGSAFVFRFCPFAFRFCFSAFVLIHCFRREPPIGPSRIAMTQQEWCPTVRAFCERWVFAPSYAARGSSILRPIHRSRVISGFGSPADSTGVQKPDPNPVPRFLRKWGCAHFAPRMPGRGGICFCFSLLPFAFAFRFCFSAFFLIHAVASFLQLASASSRKHPTNNRASSVTRLYSGS